MAHGRRTNYRIGFNMKLIISILAASLAAQAQSTKFNTIDVIPRAAAVSSVRFFNSAGTQYVGLKAGTVGSALTFILPGADGSAGQCLTTDGSLTLLFAACSGGSLTPPVTLTQNAASTTLTVGNTGAGDAIRASASAGYALNVTSGASTLAGTLNVGSASTFAGFTSSAVSTISLTNASPALTLNNGSGLALRVTAGNSEFDGSVVISAGGAWSFVPVYTVGVQNLLSLKNSIGVSMMDWDAQNNGVTLQSNTSIGTGASPKTLAVTSTLSVTGAATLSSTLGVTGAATLSSTLGVAGKLSVTSVSGAAVLDLVEIHDVAGQNRNLALSTDVAGTPSSRWVIRANTTAESGSNAGSDFALARFSDAGAFIDNPIAVTRSSGLVTVANNLTVAGTTTLNGTVAGTHGQNVGTGDSPTFSALTTTNGATIGSGLTVTTGAVAITSTSGVSVLTSASTANATWKVSNTGGSKNAIEIPAGGMLITAGGLSVSAGGLSLLAGGFSVVGGITANGSTGINATISLAKAITLDTCTITFTYGVATSTTC